MKVAFYLENAEIAGVDLSRPWLGNPGCGGTEYLFAALPHYLATCSDGICTPILLANEASSLPLSVGAIQAGNALEAATRAKAEGCDLFVFRPRRNETPGLLSLLSTLELNTVAWAHITPDEMHLRSLAACAMIKAIVCVERGQHDLAWDTSAWRKLTYIVNGFDVSGFRSSRIPEKEPGLVVFLGALVPQKGFHLLARVWKRLLARVPNAKLAVVGTGALYDGAKPLGPWGVAERSYEQIDIIPHLAGPDGKPDPSVTFMGKLGLEKKELLSRAMVGVVNPTGQSENCPGSALEFQASGTAVVSGAYYGLLDTVQHGRTGLLGRSDVELVDNLCRLLDSPDEAARLGRNGVDFVSSKYRYADVVSSWLELFSRICTIGAPPRYSIDVRKNVRKTLPVAVNGLAQRTIGRISPWPSVAEAKSFIYSSLNSNKRSGT